MLAHKVTTHFPHFLAVPLVGQQNHATPGSTLALGVWLPAPVSYSRKEKLAGAPVLSLPDPEWPFDLFTNAEGGVAYGVLIGVITGSL